MPIHNPNADPYANALLGLAVSMATGNPSTFIQEQERAAQADIVNSDVLPRDMGDRAAYEAVGFTFGATTPGDDLFVHATLPAGWRREGSDHAMWSYLVDPQGRRRVAVFYTGAFYTGAFYDRSAHMSLTTVGGYADECLNLYGDGGPLMPVLDDRWCTREAFCTALEEWADRETVDADMFEETLHGRALCNAAGCREVIGRKRAQITQARGFAAKVRALGVETEG